MKRYWIALILMIVCVLPGWAQNDEVAAGNAATSPRNGAVAEPTTSHNSESRSGSSGLPISLGLSGKKQLDIALYTTESWDTNSSVSGSGTGGAFSPSFGGTLQLVLDRQTSQTTLTYNGNGIAYPKRNPVWTSSQDLGFRHSLKLGRWTLSAADTFNYSPNSPFGGFGLSLGGSDFTSGQQVLNPQFVPNQTLLTPYATRYSNSVLGEIEYGLSRRSSWTFSGSYGTLRFADAQFYNSDQISASTGYNYSLSAQDSVSVTYSYGRTNYPSLASHFLTHTAQVGYTKSLGGRFALHVAAGPQIVDVGNLGAPDKKVQFSGTGYLAYTRGRNRASLSFESQTTGGSGVFTGSNTQSVQGSVGRQVSNGWSAALNGGYSRNSGLVQQQTYNSLFVSPNLRRSVTRNLGVTFNYMYQYQLSSSNCTTVVCGNLGRNLFSFGLDYRFSPIRLE